MKKLNRLIALLPAICLLNTGCDKDFGKINTNPYGLTSTNPALLFTNAQRLTSPGSWEGDQTIVQQFVNAYNTGATSGFNLNDDNNTFNITRWNDNYPGPIKMLEQVTALTKGDAARTNLANMTIIWKNYIYMTLVDTYGDVPYTKAGRAYLEANFYPEYDKDEVIYEGLYTNIKAAIAALNPAGELVGEDLLYGKAGSTAAQVDKWKRLGNSLLLRIGMRYSKIDQNKAKSIVQEAFNAGVMQSNSDNALVTYTSVYVNGINTNPRTLNPYFYYMAEPFINRLKATHDPRLKYISGKYSDPNQVLTLTPDTTTANQFGFPVGYDHLTVPNYPGYRGTLGTGQNYSQLNFSVLGSATAPNFFVSYAQTQLLLAEAAFRGWLTGLNGALTARQYYEAGVKANMNDYERYPNTPVPAVPATMQDNYLAQTGVAYTDANALELINTQYWIASISNGAEGFANFRRSGYPTLSPNRYNNNLQGGFVRRYPYPNDESAKNPTNYLNAVTSMGGKDDLLTRIFWDQNP
ncbi:hypothetical protein HNQ91_003485 [Filimonas zeae]|uniref:Starch-binding associating with outer membrane n=1 Tax=Filimonas zeae TaxID=1737353 RepID=A0A917IZZ1_9BACT|nr:SusD/RagB family nutrient-binding outer membrane lipoprotein [Filimonas zeae]MDR6340420.1 hypothetical protein [Filimonas zeae]GGH72646.1 hypothetical protein GCM10011379_33320 [Filimonas zeae]